MTSNAKSRDKLLKNLSKGLLLSTPLLVAGFGIAQSAIAAGACPPGSTRDSDGYCMVSSSAVVASRPTYATTRHVARPEAYKAQAEALPEVKVYTAKAEAAPEAVAAKAKGEAEAASAEAKPEAEAKGEGEAEAKGEGEAEAEGDASHVVRPRRSKRYKGGMSKVALVAKGRALYDDASLSTNGLSCNSCHTDLEGYNDTFKKRYSHYVAMGKDIYGKKKVNAETMVQICMEQPMEASPLPWDSADLAALTAYVTVVQKEYKIKAKAEGASEAKGEGEAEGR
jgi:hypothetical protein